MTTIGYENWAVDLAEVGAVYPFQGSETVMVILGVIFWLGWHVVQMRAESAQFEAARKAADPASTAAEIARY